MKNKLKVNLSALALAGALVLTMTGIEGEVKAVSTSSIVQQEETLSVHQGVNVFVNDYYYTPTDVNGNEVHPFLYNGTTYLPVRAIANIYGCDVKWDGESRSIYIGHATKKYYADPEYEEDVLKTLSLTNIEAHSDIKIYVLNDNDEYEQFIPKDVNGNEVPIILSNGTTYLPVRAISNLYNVDITWDGVSGSVYIGKHYVNDNTQNYNYYQLEALRLFSFMDYELEVLYYYLDEIEKGYDGLISIGATAVGLRNVATDEAIKEELTLFHEHIIEVYERYLYHISDSNPLLSCPEYLERRKSEFDELDNKDDFYYVEYVRNGFVYVVKRIGSLYDEMSQETLLKHRNYLIDMANKMGIDISDVVANDDFYDIGVDKVYTFSCSNEKLN